MPRTPTAVLAAQPSPSAFWASSWGSPQADPSRPLLHPSSSELREGGGLGSSPGPCSPSSELHERPWRPGRHAPRFRASAPASPLPPTSSPPTSSPSSLVHNLMCLRAGGGSHSTILTQRPFAFPPFLGFFSTGIKPGGRGAPGSRFLSAQHPALSASEGKRPVFHLLMIWAQITMGH